MVMAGEELGMPQALIGARDEIGRAVQMNKKTSV